MGWKSVKDHYGIKHQVCITPEGICIGSAYIHDIIVINLDGTIKKRYDRENEDLCRYQREMDADLEKLRQLIQAPDTFTVSIPVYTYEGGEIIEKQCEALGYPNVTHDGEMMYENRFSADKEEVTVWAKESATSRIQFWQEQIEEAEKRLAKCRAGLMAETMNLSRLMADYPKKENTTNA